MPLLIKFTLHLSLIFFLISCSVKPVSNPAPQISFPKPVLSSVSATDQKLLKYWWYARFKFVWSEKADTVDFSDNLFIAHQIIIPILDTHHDDIQLWRFHRRAADDNAGHQFSFIFYATQQTAGSIFQQIEKNALLKQLLNEGILERIRIDDITQPKRQKIEDTSDKNWSYAIQKSWPYYIMGVSTLWLDLLNQEITKSQLDTSQPIQLQRAQYKYINAQITKQWQEQGNHAFFHHISAIFGYEPLELRF